MKLITLAAALLSFGFWTNGFTAPKEKSTHKMEMMNATPEQREEMAKAHDAMAACLRSAKPMMDCHKEMMKSSMGKACPMMGHKGGHSMKHDHEMMEHEESEMKDK